MSKWLTLATMCLIALAFACLVALVLERPAPDEFWANYRKVDAGMSQRQVEQILGKPNREEFVVFERMSREKRLVKVFIPESHIGDIECLHTGGEELKLLVHKWQRGTESIVIVFDDGGTALKKRELGRLPPKRSHFQKVWDSLFGASWAGSEHIPE